MENFVFMVNLSVEKRRPYNCWARIRSSFFEALNVKVATATVSVATAVWREAMSSQGGMAPKTGTLAATDLSGGELARVTREFPHEEFHFPLRTTDAAAVLLDAAAALARVSLRLASE